MGKSAAGYHETDTPLKQANLKKFLALHMILTRNVMRRMRCNDPYWYVDCNAGPGNYAHEGDETTLGSPLVFARQACLSLGSNWVADFVERDACEFTRLQENVPAYMRTILTQHGRIACHNQDANAWMAEKPSRKMRYGLIYHDPNGMPDWGLLRLAAEKWPQMDILVNVNSTAIKRNAGVDSDVTRLPELFTIKKHVILTDGTHGKWQWLMALLTNWKGIGAWHSNGIVHWDSTQGEWVRMKAGLTRQEREERLQQKLFAQEAA